MQFVIIHGSFGKPSEAWFPQLKSDLEVLGHTVFAPAFPVDDWDEMTRVGETYQMKQQNLQNWLATFESEVVDKLNTPEPMVIVGHSIACVFILHAINQWNLHLDSAIFVAPFLEKLNKSWQIESANKSFYKSDFNFEKLRQLIPVSYSLYSKNDPYVETNYISDFANKMHSSQIEVRNAGHMGNSSGIIDFKLVLELCKSRFFYEKK